MLTLKNRTMIITGGAGNNGLAIVRMALEYGMNVAFMSSFHGKAQGAVAKMDPRYRDQVIGFAQNPQARLAEILPVIRNFIRKIPPRRMCSGGSMSVLEALTWW